jgi:hypothetical protein
LKLADVTSALKVEQRVKLAREPLTRAKPGALRSEPARGEVLREHLRRPNTADN